MLVYFFDDEVQKGIGALGYAIEMGSMLLIPFYLCVDQPMIDIRELDTVAYTVPQVF
ncbi:MAG: hypothetical protein ACREYC_03080 [Gammaproteobacteria bacterium]